MPRLACHEALDKLRHSGRQAAVMGKSSLNSWSFGRLEPRGCSMMLWSLASLRHDARSECDSQSRQAKRPFCLPGFRSSGCSTTPWPTWSFCWRLRASRCAIAIDLVPMYPCQPNPKKKFESVECQERLEDARAAPVRAGDRLGNFPHRLARALKPQQISQ